MIVKHLLRGGARLLLISEATPKELSCKYLSSSWSSNMTRGDLYTGLDVTMILDATNKVLCDL